MRNNVLAKLRDGIDRDLPTHLHIVYIFKFLTWIILDMKCTIKY